MKITEGTHLKKDIDFYSLQEGDFAIYLGIKDNKHIVGVKNDEGDIVSIIKYDSIEAVEKEWIID